MNPSKIHLCVEQFSQNSNWRLPEKDFKLSRLKDPHGMGRKGRDEVRMGFMPQGEDSEE